MKNTIKKLTLLALLLITTLGLSACGDKENDAENSSQNYRNVYEGVIEKAALSAYSEGTHRIIAEDGAYLIQSSRFNLNHYEGKQVIVSGTLEEGVANSEPVLNVEKIQVTKVSFQAPVTQYQSNTYGFSLEYPETWELNETDSGVVIGFQGEPWVNINVYNNESRLETFVPDYEDKQGVEVTVAHQRAIRFNDSNSLRLYVEHPSDRIYLIRLNQKAFSDSEKKALFYDLLASFEFLYNSKKVEGPPCGGVENKQCSEDYRCELGSASIDSVGVCVPISGSGSTTACPLISPPTNCPEYRVVEYNSNGCPFRYQCLEEGLSVFESVQGSPSSEKDLLSENVGDGTDAVDETLVDQGEQTSGNTDEEKEYVIPSVESVTGEYTTKSGLSLKYPKSWYFYNFGPQGIGFAPADFESIDQAVMILKEGSGDVVRELDGKTYGISGPDDLNAVMKAILDSME